MNQQSLRTFLLAFTGFAIVLTAMPKLPQRMASWFETFAAEQQTTPPALVSRSPEDSYVMHADAITPVAPTARHGVKTLSDEPYLVNPATAVEETSQPTQPTADIHSWERDKITLESLGARSIVLEQQNHRFQCRCLLPLAADSPYEKPFFATADQPSQALRQVIEQIERWQSQRSVRETP